MLSPVLFSYNRWKRTGHRHKEDLVSQHMFFLFFFFLFFAFCKKPDRDPNLPAVIRDLETFKTAVWWLQQENKVFIIFASLSCSLVRLRSGEFRQQPQLWPHSISPHPPVLQPAIQTWGHAVTAKQHRYLTAPPRHQILLQTGGDCHVTARLYISKPSFCHVTAEPLLFVFFHFSTLLSVDTLMYISTHSGTLPLAF